jgi:hypothetical protein
LVALTETDVSLDADNGDEDMTMNGQRALDREFGNLFSMRAPFQEGKKEEEEQEVKVTSHYSRLCHGFLSHARQALLTEARTRALSSTPAARQLAEKVRYRSVVLAVAGSVVMCHQVNIYKKVATNREVR